MVLMARSMIFRLARPDALLHLSFFGLITGFLAGGVIVLIPFAVEHTQDYFLPGTGSENYEQMSPLYHFLFPVIASVLLAILFYKWSKGLRVLGVARIMERGSLSSGLFNITRFYSTVCWGSNSHCRWHSVGREGPHAHLGASISSLFGQLLKLPNNSIRTLVASGQRLVSRHHLILRWQV